MVNVLAWFLRVFYLPWQCIHFLFLLGQLVHCVRTSPVSTLRESLRDLLGLDLYWPSTRQEPSLLYHLSGLVKRIASDVTPFTHGSWVYKSRITSSKWFSFLVIGVVRFVLWDKILKIFIIVKPIFNKLVSFPVEQVI